MASTPQLTHELVDRIAGAVRSGAPRDVAARTAGIGRSTLMLWLAQARAADDGSTVDDPCPRCGAVGDEPCTTGTGRRAPHTHSGRVSTDASRADLLAYLVDKIDEAEAAAHAEALKVIRRAGLGGTWQAAAWFLERRYPEQYGRRRIEVSGPDAGPIATVDLASLGLAENVPTDRLVELAQRFPDGDALGG